MTQPAYPSLQRDYVNKYLRQYRADPEFKVKRAAYMKAWYRKKSGDRLYWSKRAHNSIGARARRCGIAYELTPADLTLPDKCPVFGTAFVLGAQGHPHGPSVDRMIPSLGYVRGNVRIISTRANILKRDCVDANELRLVAAYIENPRADSYQII